MLVRISPLVRTSARATFRADVQPCDTKDIFDSMAQAARCGSSYASLGNFNDPAHFGEVLRTKQPRRSRCAALGVAR